MWNYKEITITSRLCANAAIHYNIHGGFTKDVNYNDQGGAL